MCTESASVSVSSSLGLSERSIHQGLDRVVAPERRYVFHDNAVVHAWPIRVYGEASAVREVCRIASLPLIGGRVTVIRVAQIGEFVRHRLAT